MSAAPVQLPLTFEHRPSLTGEDFLVAPCNRDAVQWLDRWQAWPGPALILFGPAGCGKTHLTHVFLAETGGRDVTDDLRAGAGADRLLADTPATVVEAADRLVDEGFAEALLHLYNVANENGAKILMTARQPPSRWTIGIADLGSRLKAATAVGIGAPDDALIGSLLVKLFADRQLKVEEEVVPYMLSRMERSFDAARDLVAAVDHLALSQRRNITIPLVRQALDRREKEQD